jgi:hypothetical protein
VGDLLLYHLFDLFIVRVFERVKTANIKRLEEMRGMRKYIKRDDLLYFAVFFEVDRMVVLVAVEDKELIYTLRTSFR